MTIYTMEVGGRPVAAMQSTSLGEAEEFLRSDAFLNDLTIYEMEGGEPGEPMWDGEAEILVRESFPDEVAVWERIRTKAVRDGDADPDDENFLTYLRVFERSSESAQVVCLMPCTRLILSGLIRLRQPD